MSLKTHFSRPQGAICGRPTARLTKDAFSVTCGACKRQPEWPSIAAEAIEARSKAFWAQEPRTVVPQFGRVNADGVMECPETSCKGTLWREKPRTSWAYHYVCAACGRSVHPLTETGMST